MLQNGVATRDPSEVIRYVASDDHMQELNCFSMSTPQLPRDGDFSMPSLTVWIAWKCDTQTLPFFAEMAVTTGRFSNFSVL